MRKTLTAKKNSKTSGKIKIANCGYKQKLEKLLLKVGKK